MGKGTLLNHTTGWNGLVVPNSKGCDYWARLRSITSHTQQHRQQGEAAVNHVTGRTRSSESRPRSITSHTKQQGMGGESTRQRLPRREWWRGGAAPRSVARQTLPRHRSALRSSPRQPSRRATMHGTAQAFGRARAIGAAKSVSFKIKNPMMLDLKLNSKKG